MRQRFQQHVLRRILGVLAVTAHPYAEAQDRPLYDIQRTGNLLRIAPPQIPDRLFQISAQNQAPFRTGFGSDFTEINSPEAPAVRS